MLSVSLNETFPSKLTLMLQNHERTRHNMKFKTSLNIYIYIVLLVIIEMYNNLFEKDTSPVHEATFGFSESHSPCLQLTTSLSVISTT